MTTAPDRIAVIAMQLARTDRRALSQAWYDALHQRTQLPATVKPVPTAAVGSAIPRPAFEARGAGPSAAASSRGIGVVARSRSGDPRAERVGGAEPGAERLQTRRRIVSPAGAPRTFARTVTLGSARVRLLVRTDAGGTRIVALCASADRERVARALAAVRVALASAGVTLAA